MDPPVILERFVEIQYGHFLIPNRNAPSRKLRRRCDELIGLPHCAPGV